MTKERNIFMGRSGMNGTGAVYTWAREDAGEEEVEKRREEKMKKCILHQVRGRMKRPRASKRISSTHERCLYYTLTLYADDKSERASCDRRGIRTRKQRRRYVCDVWPCAVARSIANCCAHTTLLNSAIRPLISQLCLKISFNYYYWQRIKYKNQLIFTIGKGNGL